MVLNTSARKTGYVQRYLLVASFVLLHLPQAGHSFSPGTGSLENGVRNAFSAFRSSRLSGPVVITGAPVQGLVGSRIPNIGIFAVRNGALSPIPFQIDKKDIEGEYIFSLEQERDSSHDRSKRWKAERERLANAGMDAVSLEKYEQMWGSPEDLSVFDTNDELAFMAWDAGEKIAESVTRPKAKVWIELKVTGTSGELAGFVYAGAFDSPPAASDTDYVSYNARAQEIQSAFAVVDFDNTHPFIMDGFYSRTGVDSFSPNLLDRFKLRLRLKTMALFTINFDEEDVQSRTIASKDGPVRVIRRNLFWLEFLFLRVTPKAYVNYIFYPDGMIVPLLVQVPFDPRLALRSGSEVTFGLDLSNAARGTRLKSPRNSGVFNLDGSMSSEEGSLETRDHKWFSLVFPGYSEMLVEFDMSDGFKSRGLTLNLDYRDDSEARWRPEREPGDEFVGIRADALKVPPGDHRIQFMIRYLPVLEGSGETLRPAPAGTYTATGREL